MARSRSNSNSLQMQLALKGSNSDDVLESTARSFTNNDVILKRFDSNTSAPKPAVTKPKLSYILTLSPLNSTFERKNLTLPTFPQTLKLGRPLTSNSSGNQVSVSTRNGFFESRILSRTHAQLQLTENNDILLTDLNSSNGTYLNDIKLQPMKPYKISQGDVITLGADIIPNSTGNASHDNVVHRRIVALVEEIIPVVDMGYSDSGSFATSMLQSSLFGDLLGDFDDHNVLSHENGFLLEADEGGTEGEGIASIYTFLKKEIRHANERNHKLERINLFINNFVHDLTQLEENKAKHMEQVKKNYYELIKENLSKKYELVQEKNIKILKDKNASLENSIGVFRKEHDGKVLEYESEINRMRNTIEDLETKLQVANVKQSGDVKRKPIDDAKRKQIDDVTVSQTDAVNISSSTDALNISPATDEFNIAPSANDLHATLSGEKESICKDDGVDGAELLSGGDVPPDSAVAPGSKNYRIAYISSICVVGLISAFVAYSQNK